MARRKWTSEKIDPDVNPVGVECCMMLEYGSLGHLSEEVWKKEVAIAKACEAEEPGFLRKIADSYGMLAEFDEWQKEKARKIITISPKLKTRAEKRIIEINCPAKFK